MGGEGGEGRIYRGTKQSGSHPCPLSQELKEYSSAYRCPSGSAPTPAPAAFSSPPSSISLSPQGQSFPRSSRTRLHSNPRVFLRLLSSNSERQCPPSQRRTLRSRPSCSKQVPPLTPLQSCPHPSPFSSVRFGLSSPSPTSAARVFCQEPPPLAKPRFFAHSPRSVSALRLFAIAPSCHQVLKRNYAMPSRT